MKTCFKCGETKPFDNFYRNYRMADGYMGKCKECTKADTKRRVRMFPELVAEYEEKRKDMHHRVVERAEHRKAYRTKFPEKYRAHGAVARAIKNGILVRESCPCGRKAVAHHEDYSKPLEVVWLCQCCHKRYHADRGD